MLRQLRIIGVLLFVSMTCCTWLFWTYEHDINPRVHTYGDAL